MHDKKSGTDPLTDLMADGVPAEMPQDAKDGVQVIIDNSAKLNDPKAMMEAYRALPEGDRESVNALVQYVATACGTDIVKGRSEERRVGKEGVSTCSTRRSPVH